MSVGLRTFYVLRCLTCDEESDMPLPMPFATPDARGCWASEHTKATGHFRWDVTDEPREVIDL